jgi:ABC-2 type transport system ATP-binding protein
VAAGRNHRVVADLEAAGVDFDSFTWAEPSLEDVYLRLTGEALDGDGTGVEEAGR